MDKWISKIWSIPTEECYAGCKAKGMLMYVIAWMNIEDIRLSKISQSLKDKYCDSTYSRAPQRMVKLLETKSRLVVVRSWGKGRW